MDTKIGSGYDACPSCKSDSWKSAKLIVLEGTSITKGGASGKVTDPGALSGGVRELLLSDRWFSWDHEIDIGIGLTTTNGLAEEVKLLMVANSTLAVMPPIPPEPKKIGPLEKIRPIKPVKPVLEKPVKPEKKPWWVYFLKSTVTALKISVAIWFIVGLLFNFTLGFFISLTALIISLPINITRSFWGNERAKNTYNEKVRNFPAEIKQYKININQYELSMEKYHADCQAAIKQDEDAAHALAIYQTKMIEYERERNQVLKTRELLWERARVCMRCGTGYLGNM